MANYRRLHIRLISYKKINIFFCIKMVKINGENLDLKSKLNIVRGIIANAKNT